MENNATRLPEHLRQRFRTHFTEIKVEGESFKFLEIDNLEVILDEIVTPPEDPGQGRPFWIKIWESSIVLASWLAGLKVDPARKMLEIGAGMGVAGIVAARFGHDVTVTDNNEDALAFVRVNAEANGLPNLPVRNLDWREIPEQPVWDVILGADVVYQESGHENLVAFLRAALKKDGVIYFALSGFIQARAFFEEMSKHFSIKRKGLVMRSDEEQFPVNLFMIRFP